MPTSGYRSGKRSGKRAAKNNKAQTNTTPPSFRTNSAPVTYSPLSESRAVGQINNDTPSNPARNLSSSTFEIRPIPGKGKGMVALVDIPKGTRINAEAPLVLVPGGAPPEIMEGRVKREYDALSPDKQVIFDSLHVAYPDRPNKLWATFETNSLPAGPVNGAVYATVCMINHSCAPNGYHAWNEGIGKETVHAIRDIMAGEEITMSYGMDDTRIRSDRHGHLERIFGFKCMCSLCDVSEEEAAASDARRSKIKHLHERIGSPLRVQMNPDAVLGDCKAINDLRQQEFGSTADGYVAATFYDAFQVAAAHGRLRLATNFATLACRTRLALEGEDSPETQRMKQFSKNPRLWRAYGAYAY